MRHLTGFTWKPIDWYPESADQYPDGLPTAKPEDYMVDLGDGRLLYVTGLQLGATVEVRVWTEGTEFPPTPTMSVPADRVHDVVDALLYVHRRTHEREYEAPPGSDAR
jgi:hypothetical protein